MDHQLVETLGIYAGTAAVCAVSSLVPLVNSEVFLLVVATAASPAQLPALAVSAACGQMVGKAVLYGSGRGVLPGNMAESSRLGRWKERLSDGRHAEAIVLASAVTGVPPFYVVSVLAGALRWSFARFLAAGLLGRLLRFGALMTLPYVLKEVWP